MQHFDPPAYGPTVAALLKDAKLNELGPGSSESSMRKQLAALTPEAVAAPHALGSRDMALACISGLWLRHDFLEESHRFSQDLENSSGSYWHAIMHRREPDFSNAKYWFRRVGDHRVFEPLRCVARDLAAEGGASKAADFLFEQSAWDPIKFVDLCEIALDGSRPMRTLCMKIQQCEWELLFDYCYRQAIDE
jgi:hypothetical protein